jgi:TDG/mug DNA glycosylase family protein
MMVSIWKPSKEKLAAAYGKKVPDLIAPRLKVLFVGINPGLYSAAVGHHFARPGNRFWPALYHAGYTDRLLSPFEERALLKHKYGVTNVVNRATAGADELRRHDFVAGARVLKRKINRFKPRCVAFLGIGAYRLAFGHPKAKLGPQEHKIGDSVVWVLPNPSGLNAHHQLRDLTRMFKKLKMAAESKMHRTTTAIEA